MEIEYLKKLEGHPYRGPYVCEGVSVDEIVELEQVYNNGNPFPRVLKEMLFLAGKYCTVLTFNTYNSQLELQAAIRDIKYSPSLDRLKLIYN